MMRSLANATEGGTTDINKNILGERVLGPAQGARPVEGQAVEGHSAIMTAYQRLIVDEVRRRRLADPQPPGRGQRLRRPHARRTRGRMGRARRRSRRAGDRQHRQRQGVLHRYGRRAGRSRQGRDAPALTPDPRRRAEDLVVALRGVEAGDRRGQRRVRGRWTAPGGRRRHRHRRRDRRSFVDPHVSVGQAVAYEAITLLRKSPMEAITRMALSGRGERISADARLPARHRLRRRPRRRTARDRRDSLAAAVAANSPTAMRATKTGAVARARGRPDTGTQRCRATRSGGCAIIPITPRAPKPGARSGRHAGSAGSLTAAQETHDVPATDRRAPRPGRLDHQQPSGSAQRLRRGHARGIPKGLDRTRRRPRRSGDRAHRQWPGLPGRRRRRGSGRRGGAAVPGDDAHARSDS